MLSREDNLIKIFISRNNRAYTAIICVNDLDNRIIVKEKLENLTVSQIEMVGIYEALNKVKSLILNNKVKPPMSIEIIPYSKSFSKVTVSKLKDWKNKNFKGLKNPEYWKSIYEKILFLIEKGYHIDFK